MSVQALHGNLNFTLPNLIEVNNARSPSLEGGFLNEFKTALDTIS